jgi:hypothetical protein
MSDIIERLLGAAPTPDDHKEAVEEIKRLRDVVRDAAQGNVIMQNRMLAEIDELKAEIKRLQTEIKQ